MNFYPFHIGDYLSHTVHLSDAEDLTYRRMLDLYYQSEEPFRDEDKVLISRKVRSTLETVELILSEFFVYSNDNKVWNHIRCDSEIVKYRMKADSARNANQIRWGSGRHLKSDVKSDLKSDTDQIPTNNQEPITNKTLRPADVSELVWADFLALRKIKKAPLTPTAFAGIKSQAAKAGISVEAALEMCCARGWQSFSASYLKDEAKPTSGSQLTYLADGTRLFNGRRVT
jgi:uncharacterized protein YdaU (DUF1376 family)